MNERAAFRTYLLHGGPAPDHYIDETPPDGAQETTYLSGELRLKLWIFRPFSAPGKKCPALVYFHGGFAFDVKDMLLCKKFMDAGFIVVTPMLRAENGNPGNFEMFFGEVNDARAAIRWTADQEGVDPGQIYCFGHSAGGNISALVSLYDDVPVHLSGSSGGLLGPKIMKSKSTGIPIPFNFYNEEEISMRTLVGHVRDMKIRHIAYVGTEDYYQEVDALERELKPDSKLTIVPIDGTHISILNASLNRFLVAVQSDIAQITHRVATNSGQDARYEQK